MLSLIQSSTPQSQHNPQFGNYKPKWRAYFKSRNRGVSLPATPVYSPSTESLFVRERKAADELFSQNPEEVVSHDRNTGKPVRAKQASRQKKLLFNIKAWREALWLHVTNKQKALRQPTSSTAEGSTATGYEREGDFLAREAMQAPSGSTTLDKLGQQWEEAHDNYKRKKPSRSNSPAPKKSAQNSPSPLPSSPIEYSNEDAVLY
jgi:hypothetical protein